MNITLPGFVAFGLAEQYYCYIARFDGFSARYHAGLDRHFIAFSPVARYTGRDYIGPFGLAAPRPGNNVIYRQGVFSTTTVLASIVIAGKETTAGKGEIEEAGDRNISDEADDHRIGEGTPLGS